LFCAVHTKILALPSYWHILQGRFLSYRQNTKGKRMSNLTLKLALAATLMGISIAVKAQEFPAEVSVSTSPTVLTRLAPATFVASGVWLNGCVPTSVGSSIAFNGNFEGLLRLKLPPPGTVCIQATTRWQVTVSAPSFSWTGRYSLDIVDENGTYYGRKVLTVQPAGIGLEAFTAYSSVNVGGSWYVPLSSGSGLSLAHNDRLGGDAVWGSWNNYTPNGDASWYALQQGRWESPTRLTGVLYQTRGQALVENCTTQFPPNPFCPNPLRPVPFQTVTRIGSFQFDVTGAATADMQFRLDVGNATGVLGIPSSVFKLQRL
jgi:hypothetical protein